MGISCGWDPLFRGHGAKDFVFLFGAGTWFPATNGLASSSRSTTMSQAFLMRSTLYCVPSRPSVLFVVFLFFHVRGVVYSSRRYLGLQETFLPGGTGEGASPFNDGTIASVPSLAPGGLLVRVGASRCGFVTACPMDVFQRGHGRKAHYVCSRPISNLVSMGVVRPFRAVSVGVYCTYFCRYFYLRTFRGLGVPVPIVRNHRRVAMARMLRAHLALLNFRTIHWGVLCK